MNSFHSVVMQVKWCRESVNPLVEWKIFIGRDKCEILNFSEKDCCFANDFVYINEHAYFYFDNPLVCICLYVKVWFSWFQELMLLCLQTFLTFNFFPTSSFQMFVLWQDFPAFKNVLWAVICLQTFLTLLTASCCRCFWYVMFFMIYIFHLSNSAFKLVWHCTCISWCQFTFIDHSLPWNVLNVFNFFPSLWFLDICDVSGFFPDYKKVLLIHFALNVRAINK